MRRSLALSLGHPSFARAPTRALEGRLRAALWLGLASALTACVGAPTHCASASGAGVTQAAAMPAPTTSVASGEVRAASAAERRISPNGKANVTLLAQGQNAFVGRLELAPDAKVPEHQDPTEEYIHVLSGHATMVMDGVTYPVEPGTTIYMPAYAKVSVQNGSEPLVGLQVFAGPEPAEKYQGWVLVKE